MSDIELGKLITTPQERDAVHVAIIPMIAGEELYPGQRFRLKYGTTDVAMCADYNEEDAIGIIDPFLVNNDRITEGVEVWGMLFPNTVTGMRHHWQHPAFANVERTDDEHELWLRNFCDEWNFDFKELIDAGIGDDDWRYVVARGHDLHSPGELGEDLDLFWRHLEGYTGRKFDAGHREGMGWSCTC